MYGYVVVNKPELKFREYDVYRSYYCGLCKALGKQYGMGSRMTLSYDCTFLVMLLSGLYEPQTDYAEKRCIAHPAGVHPERKNAVTDYVADMNVLLAYYKCMDDWADERKVSRRAMAMGLKNSVKRIQQQYPEKAKVIQLQLQQLSQLEQNRETNIDKMSACFGNVLAEIMVYRQDEWESTLRGLGYALGRFIYLMDAYDDLDSDMKKGRYNVLAYHKDISDFDNFCEGILNSLMAACAGYFERLPIVQDTEILRNIIYSGVWTRFGMVRSRRQSVYEQEKNN